MVRLLTRYSLFAIVSLVVVQPLVAQEQAPKPVGEMTISDIMKECHKKPVQLLKKVATGQADQQEKERLAAVYKQLKALSPPTGDAQSWTDKTELLVSAATAAVANKSESRAMLTKASNCKSCHDAHKE